MTILSAVLCWAIMPSIRLREMCGRRLAVNGFELSPSGHSKRKFAPALV